MSEQEYNHYAPRNQIDESILTGSEVTALCGERFTVGLRVGSSGKADAPELDVCPRCDQIWDLMGRREELDEQRARVSRDIRVLQSGWRAERERVAECV